MGSNKKRASWVPFTVLDLVLASAVVLIVGLVSGWPLAAVAGVALFLFFLARAGARVGGFAALVLVLLAVSHAQAAATAVGVTKCTRTGVTLTAQAIDYSGGNYMQLTGQELLVVTTTSMDVSATVTEQLINSNGYTNDAICFTPAGKTKVFGPWKMARWADGNGRMQFTWTASGSTTGATVLGMKLAATEPEIQTK